MVDQRNRSQLARRIVKHILDSKIAVEGNTEPFGVVFVPSKTSQDRESKLRLVQLHLNNLACRQRELIFELESLQAQEEASDLTPDIAVVWAQQLFPSVVRLTSFPDLENLHDEISVSDHSGPRRLSAAQLLQDARRWVDAFAEDHGVGEASIPRMVLRIMKRRSEILKVLFELQANMGSLREQTKIRRIKGNPFLEHYVDECRETEYWFPYAAALMGVKTVKRKTEAPAVAKRVAAPPQAKGKAAQRGGPRKAREQAPCPKRDTNKGPRASSVSGKCRAGKISSHPKKSSADLASLTSSLGTMSTESGDFSLRAPSSEASMQLNVDGESNHSKPVQRSLNTTTAAAVSYRCGVEPVGHAHSMSASTRTTPTQQPGSVYTPTYRPTESTCSSRMDYKEQVHYAVTPGTSMATYKYIAQPSYDHHQPSSSPQWTPATCGHVDGRAQKGFTSQNDCSKAKLQSRETHLSSLQHPAVGYVDHQGIMYKQYDIPAANVQAWSLDQAARSGAVSSAGQNANGSSSRAYSLVGVALPPAGYVKPVEPGARSSSYQAFPLEPTHTVPAARTEEYLAAYNDMSALKLRHGRRIYQSPTLRPSETPVTLPSKPAVTVEQAQKQYQQKSTASTRGTSGSLMTGTTGGLWRTSNLTTEAAGTPSLRDAPQWPPKLLSSSQFGTYTMAPLGPGLPRPLHSGSKPLASAAANPQVKGSDSGAEEEPSCMRRTRGCGFPLRGAVAGTSTPAEAASTASSPGTFLSWFNNVQNRFRPVKRLPKFYCTS